MNSICLIVMLISLSNLAYSQPAPTIPPPPYLSDLPPYASWTVVYTIDNNFNTTSPDKTASAQKPSFDSVPKEVRITKLDKETRGRVFWNSGKTSEIWAVDSFVLSERPTSSDIYVMDRRMNGLATAGMKSPDDLPELSWLSKETFKDQVTFMGKECYLFIKGDALPASNRANGLPTQRESSVVRKPETITQAWIEKKTLLPCAIDDGVLLKVYTFQGSDFPRPEMPARFAKALSDYKAKADQSKYLRK